MFRNPINVVVIGCGGIGGYLCRLLPQTMACLYVDSLDADQAQQLMQSEGMSNGVRASNAVFSSLTLIDGDTFSGHNALRQEGTAGSKLATVMSMIRSTDAFSTWLNATELVGYNNYITPRNIHKILNLWNNVVIFLCVDNHKTRYEVTRWVVDQKMQNILIINGGNKKTAGNVTVFQNNAGKLLDPPIYKLYPEVTDKFDRRPDEIDCGSVSVTNDQTAVTNNMIASIMLAMFSKYVRTGGFDQKTRHKDANGNNIVVRKNEVVVDFETMTMQSFAHSPDTDNTPLQSVLEGVPEGETEII